MYCKLLLSLVALLFLALQTTALPGFRSSLGSLVPWETSLEKRQLDNSNKFETENNGSEFLWLIQDTYEGQSFFDRWSFFSQGDPTHGQVSFVDQQTAFDTGLAYVTADNIVVMKGDNTTWLAAGQVRSSVRISSVTQYTTGLFILDLNRAPWGCGVWPAFWTCGPNWPYGGEIDVLEGVHDNEHNQVTWHTGPGCNLTPNDNFTGTIVGTLDCDGTVSGNPGCGITEWSRASYGPYFDSQQGGVYAMKWDDEGIAVYNFYRAAIPQDITDGQSPNPSTWGEPAAQLSPAGCNISKFFSNHSIIFDITFCGDWAGNSYATSGCPGTCAERIMDPSNFVNASWSINSLKVYQKTVLTGSISDAKRTIALDTRVVPLITCALMLTMLALVGL
ncbi:glycoside hydrolase family 16 protein [Piloderma croceum F 1598]|uniref:Glycoside hydrolase family 16 protein n=1 Tax=Piloderma croceum (strain F 1598) TaxID=765440 RepID=A0A0C3FMC7_PILCF|nr:glycoside hydrolase family 16 protein [Piloderma croceum F 1598]